MAFCVFDHFKEGQTLNSDGEDDLEIAISDKNELK